MHLVQNIQDVAESLDKTRPRIHPNNNFDIGSYRQNHLSAVWISNYMYPLEIQCLKMSLNNFLKKCFHSHKLAYFTELLFWVSSATTDTHLNNRILIIVKNHSLTLYRGRADNPAFVLFFGLGCFAFLGFLCLLGL